MNKTLDSLRVRAGVILAACVLLLAGTAWADPPGRVVRLAYVNGPVSFLAAGDTDWVQAAINRPLWTGDRLWTGSGARAELQIGGAALRIAPETSITVINFDDRIAQFEVAQGAIQYRVRTIDSGDTIEIDTPNLAFSVQRPGEYRVDVTPDGDATSVTVFRGEAQAFGAQNAYVIAAGTSYRFRGTDLTDYVPEPIARRDALDTWAAERVSIEERSQSARYVSPDMIGYADLDANGTWRTDASYGPIWVPTRVAVDWAPYRYGHWAWVDPWGWTWIDDAPWGFAPFHYGRWAFVQNRWGWIPGPRAVRPVYAPALVAFVGGNNFSVALSLGSGGGIGWFPLGPGDVYRPAYTTSREYFTRVNVNNTVVNVTNVTNIYNNPTTNIRYANATNVNAVTAVPTQAFVDARPVQRAAIKMNAQAVQQAQVVPHVEVAPVRTSIVGAAAPAQARPSRAVGERTVVAKQAPPPAPAPIEQRQEALKRQPGKPLEATELQRLGGQTPAGQTPAAKPNVRVAQPAAAPKPMAAAAPSTNRGGAPAAAPPAGTAGQPPVAGAAPKADEMRRGGPPPTTMGAEKQGPPPGRPEPGRPESKGPPPAATAPSAPPTVMDKQGPQTGRPESKGPPPAAAERGGPPATEARPRNVPPPSAAPSEPPGRAATARPEAKGPPPTATEGGAPPATEARPRNVPPPSAAPPEPPGRAATARPEAAPMTQGPAGREQVQRQGPPPSRPEPVAPPAARAPANVPPPVVQTPPQAQPRPESANVSRPPATVQGPPPRPETANAPQRPVPREAGPPPSRQAQTPPPTPQGPPPSAAPPQRQPPPQAAQAPGRAPDRGPPPKDKDKDKDKEKDKDKQ